jgi:hypothetical protein
VGGERNNIRKKEIGMIVGGGIIARSMSDLIVDATIFASGVSNSSCTDPLEFLREKQLLLSQDRGRKLVYFSTCSLSDGSVKNAYLLHKLEMEKLVSENFEEWLVLRIPTVVGSGGNTNNFFNYISKRLRKNELVYAQSLTYRHLLDAEDIKKLVSTMIEKTNKEIVDVCLDNSATALWLISMMKSELGSDSEIVILTDTTNQIVDNTRLKSIIGDIFDQINTSDYNNSLIKKYLRL